MGTQYRRTSIIQRFSSSMWPCTEKRQYRVKGINQVSQKKFVKLCRILGNETYAKVKTGKNLYFEFKVNTGFRQGDAIAPLLFNTVL